MVNLESSGILHWKIQALLMESVGAARIVHVGHLAERLLFEQPPFFVSFRFCRIALLEVD